nr:hypothetical protein [uncultured Pseudomonas sp.]
MSKIENESIGAGVCRLCCMESKLCDSHIIPRAFFKMAKDRSSQLVIMTIPNSKRPRLDNVNWTEPLFCETCEGFLRDSYETSQLEKLKGARDKITSAREKLTLYALDYQRFYLFWLSIFWRAGISKLDVFSNVELPMPLMDLMRLAIQTRQVKYEHYDLSELLQIGIVKIKPHGFLQGDDIRGMMSSFRVFNNNGFPCYLLLVGGLAVVYQLADEVRASMPAGFKGIKNSRVYRIPKYEPAECEVLRQIFSETAEVALQFPELIGGKAKKELR